MVVSTLYILRVNTRARREPHYWSGLHSERLREVLALSSETQGSLWRTEREDSADLQAQVSLSQSVIREYEQGLPCLTWHILNSMFLRVLGTGWGTVPCSSAVYIPGMVLDIQKLRG